MARLWTCGFELQSLTANVECTSTTGTVSISTTVHRAGAASLRTNPTAGTAYVEHQVTAATGTARSFHRFYLRIATAPSAVTEVYGIGQSGSSPHRLRLNTDRTLQLYDATAAATVGTASAALSTDTWYRIEIDDQDAFPGPGTITAYLNGVQFGTGSITGINPSSNTGFSRVRIGPQTTCTTDLFFDDIAINNLGGSAQTSLPGPGNVVHLLPDSAGDNTGWTTTVGGTSNWQRVSEVTPDDATTYNATAATGTTATDDFNLGSASAAGISGERVTLVAVGGRVGSDATTTASLVYRIKSQAAGTVLESSSVSVALNGWASHKSAAPFIHQLTSYTDPQAGGAWTTSLLDTAQIGYRSNVSQTTTRRVSTLWALVETVPITTAALGIASETGAAQPLARTKTLALGIATETSTARALSQPLAQLKDAFDDGTIDTAKWPNSFGNVSEVGGRARVACDTVYNAVSSALMYTLHESSVYVRAYAPAAGGATTEAWAQVLIKSITAGTDLGFELRMTTGDLVMFSRVEFVDAGEVTLTYSPTDHAWLRVRETGGTTYWDTSPDGSTWTNRRTLTSPAWVSDTDLEFQLIAHRSDGTDDFAEFDNVNTGAASGQPLTLAPETDTAQTLAPSKSRAVGLASESAAAQTLARSKRTTLTLAATSEAAQPLARAKRRTLGTASETGTAQSITGRKARALSPAAETSTALLLSPASGLQLAEETDTARPLTRTKRATLGTATESTAARPLGSTKTRALPTAAESASSLSLGGGKARALASSEETETARPLTGAKARAVGVASETTLVSSLAKAKAGLISTASAVETALPVTGSLAGSITAAVETDTARPFGTAKTQPLSTAAETSSAEPVGAVKRRLLATTTEAALALPLSKVKARALGTATVIGEAQQLGAVTTAALGAATETSRALIGPKIRITPAVELGQAMALTGVRQRPADHLGASASGPVLTPSTSGPGLAASSGGPRLTVSTTTGG